VAILCDTRGLSTAEIGRRVGRSREAIGNLGRLLELPDEAPALIDNGQLRAGHGAGPCSCARTTSSAGAWLAGPLPRTGRWATSNAPPAGAPPPTRTRRPPDHAALAAQLEDRFGTAVGRDVRVEAEKPGGFGLILELGDGADGAVVLGRIGAPATPGDAIDGAIALDARREDEPERSGGEAPALDRSST
jgi:ParB-like chromosome segregation protein Spo0J